MWFSGAVKEQWQPPPPPPPLSLAKAEAGVHVGVKKTGTTKPFDPSL